MKEGHKLLKLFREEQSTRDNLGCMCHDCIEDMDIALKKYNKLIKKQRGELRMERWININRCEKCKKELEGWHLVNRGDIDRSLCSDCFNKEQNAQ